MGQFDEFIKKDREIQKGNQVEMQQEAPLQYQVEQQNVYSAEDDMERFYERLSKTSMKERAKYYFANQESEEARIKKYNKLGGFWDNTFNKFAKTHTNRSAYKRKKSSKKAAKLFKDVKKMQAEYIEKVEIPGLSKTSLHPDEIFQMKINIMTTRLEAMKEVAKAKATDENDEKYREAKATFKCYTTLLEQGSGVREVAQNKELMAQIKERISSAISDMKTYGEGRQATKKLENNYHWNSTDIVEKTKEAKALGEENTYEIEKDAERQKRLKEGFPVEKRYLSYEMVQKNYTEQRNGAENKRFTKESYELYKQMKMTNQQIAHPDIRYYYDAKISYRYLQDVSRLTAGMFRIVKYDENWQPITEEDKKNHEYNLKVSKLVKKTREGDTDAENELSEMVIKHSKYIMDNALELASPEQIEKDLIQPLLEKKDLAQTGCKFADDALKDMDKLMLANWHSLAAEGAQKFLPKVGEHVKSTPKLDAYLDAIKWYSYLMNMYFTDRYGLDVQYGSNAKADYIKASADQAKFFLTMYKEGYDKWYKEKKKEEEEKKAKKKA